MKKKRYEAEGAKRIQRSKHEETEGIEEIKAKVQSARTLKLTSTKTTAGEGPNLRETVDPQLFRTGLGNLLLKNKRFSADGQNIAKNCTTMKFVVTMQYWTAASSGKKSATDPL